MKSTRVFEIIALGLLALYPHASVFGNTLYVAQDNANAAPPYTNWATAAATIQQAIDAAVAGDVVLVSNGVYATGGRVMYRGLMNRVAIHKPITVRSVNGSAVTTIRGARSLRCVYLVDGAVLTGFTLTNGHTRIVGAWEKERSGGGVWCESAAAVLSNCVLTGNSATYGGGAYKGTFYNCALIDNNASYGGGVYGGAMYQCTLTSNSATYGGGAHHSTVFNCTLTGNDARWIGGGAYLCTSYNCTLADNFAYYGGGAVRGTLYNCIVYYNHGVKANYSKSALSYCCTTPDPGGVGNITNGPMFVYFAAGNLRLSSDSPCINAGTNQDWMMGAVDLDGNPRIAGELVDMGAYERSDIIPPLPIHYVSLSGAHVAPFNSWRTAATNIQAAIDVAEIGDIVLVTNGVYAAGGAFAAGLMNRVAITNEVTVRSVNGPEVTIIEGQGLMGVEAVRCVYVVDGAALVGFTLTNGFTQASFDKSGFGGGIFCDSAAGTISNCVLTGNSAYYGGGAYNAVLDHCVLIGNTASSGGGAFGGALYNCALSKNSASGGGGASGSALYNCALTDNSASFSGGGASGGTLNNCTLTGNSSSNTGGGAFGGTLNNCALTGNSAASGGGGVSGGTLNNCTLTGNLAYDGGGAYNGTLNNCTLIGNSASYSGGGTYYGTLYNCIVYYNSALAGANYDSGSTLNYCCTLPIPFSGTNNFTNAPGLAGLTNPHLTQGSPCIDTGNNAYVFTATDLDGEARTNGTTVDVGCDEFWVDSCMGTLHVAILTPAGTQALVGYPLSFQAEIEGRPLTYVWRFGDGTSTTNEPAVSHAYESLGEYSVTLEAANLNGGVSATVTVRIVTLAEATRYVVANGNDVADGTSWATAKATIQAGIAAVTIPGGLVLVSNGVYATGGAFTAGLTNRVAITNALTVQSVNGPEVTIIQGQGPMGIEAVRCAYVADGTALIGFTLTNGFTQDFYSYPEGSGGGVYCDSTAGIVSNCTLAGNSAFFGGGTYNGTLYNCTLTGNSAYDGGGVSIGTLYNCTLIRNSSSNFGGGAAGSTLNNCTLIGNSAIAGGGAAGGTLNNCIVYYNNSPNGANYYDISSVLNYCCTWPMPSLSSGANNFTNAPGLAGLTNPHLTQDSPCIDAGNNDYVFTAADLDGEARTNGTTVDVGCDEFWADSCTGTLQVAILTPAGTQALVGYPLSFQAEIEGRPLTYVWRFGDGTSTTNEPAVSHAYESLGEYSVTLEATNLSGAVSATVTVRIVSIAEATRYVAVDGSDAADGMSWATAKATIQGGIAVTIPGGLVLVSNGVYATGGAFAAGLMNRVVITNVVTVQSVNGPEVTIIQGQGPMGMEAVRCAYVADGAALVGFTLTNGFTQASFDNSGSGSGGGIYCDSAAGAISNCALAGNSAVYGGGAYNGTFHNCTVTGNSASYGGGVSGGLLYNCTLTRNLAENNGGGAGGTTLYNCTLTGNSADYGGGAHYGTLNNCILTSNSASYYGGGTYNGTLYNCTLTGNSANYGGGAFGGTLNNCIIYYNSALEGTNYDIGNSLNYCCTLPMPFYGLGNFTNAPGLTGLTNPHLTQGSPCIDAGNNDYVFTTADLDGEARTNGTTVDVGCDEFWADSCTGTLRVAILTPAGTNTVTGYPLSFQADIGGRPLTYVWQFGDGASTTNETVVSHAYESLGEYSVLLEAANLSGSVSATVTVRIVSMAEATRYVTTNGNDAADGMSWATAKATIQAGISITPPGGLVLVSNGVYAAGGAFAAGLTNRVAITKDVTVQSVNGPEVTIIQGQGPMGTEAVRCAYVADGTALIGFTLTNGFTRDSYNYQEGAGGGVYCVSTGGIISNCVLTGNSAYYGGGAYRGALHNCVLTGNSANWNGGGTAGGTLNNCTLTGNSADYGGGAHYGTLNNCILTSNSASYYGGGGSGGTFYNCTLTGNSAYSGGGASDGTFHNCTLTGNSASNSGGGAHYGTLNNCILTSNSASYYGGGGSGGTFYNCTLTSNSAYSGGGASDGTFHNCTLTGNSASYGGGVNNGTLHNCILTGNSASNSGGGAYNGRLYNCTLIGNLASYTGGGIFGGTLYNCIVYYNKARNDANYNIYSVVNYCCTLPMPLPVSGFGNFTNVPGLAGLTNPHLTQGSPCIDAGNNDYVFTATDLDGEARTNGTTVDVGCDEFWTEFCTGTLQVAILTPAGTNATTGYPLSFQVDIGGHPLTYVWRFGDGASMTNETVVSHAYESPGEYSVVLEAANLSGGVSATVTVQIISLAEATRYVAVDGNDEADGTSWATAKATIQAGVVAATTPGGLILVSNGVYAAGGAFAAGLTNRVVITNALTVRSVNGPEVTIIQGQGPMGIEAVRCAYVADGTKLVGFTLTNGFTQTSYDNSGSGGGIYCDSTAGIVSNCTLTGNSAYWDGGGAYYGTLYKCTLSGNSAYEGGGAYYGTLHNCTMTGNSAGGGGGAEGGTLNNCTLIGNSANNGGGTAGSTLNNCTLTGNSASNSGGGTFFSTLNNCIAYYNTAPQDPNYFGDTLNYCCTLPMPSSGTGNFTNVPGLAGLINPHLTQGSPCIDAGNNDYVFTAVDLDGEARTNGTTVDVGCDEFWADSCTGTLRVAILTPVGANALVGYPLSFQAEIEGRPLTYVWRFGDGTSTTNEPAVSHAYESPGEYSVVLEAANLSGGMSATVTVRIVSMAEATRYVAIDGNDAADGTSWATAKATIQAGIDVTISGGLVLVSNGVYATGGVFAAGQTNRVVITNAVTVQSVNGPEETIIQGQGPIGIEAVRCAYLADRTALIGFTLTNGFTPQLLYEDSGSGGGVYCNSPAGIVSNCTLSGNSAILGGGRLVVRFTTAR